MNNVKLKLIENGIMVKDVATWLGISRNHAGQRLIHLDRLKLNDIKILCDKLNMKFEELFID